MPTKAATETTEDKAEVTRTTKVPASAKQPTDHKPKTVEPEKPTVTSNDDGFTVAYRGATVHIGTEALNDFELLEDASEGDPTKLPSVLHRLVGNQYDEVKEACRDPKTGRVLLDGDKSVAQWISEVFEAISPS